MDYIFYKNLRPSESTLNLSDEFSLVWFNPKLVKLKLHSASRLRYFFWYLITLGKFKIVYVKSLKSNKICHYSHVFPKTLQFPFMSKSDKHIINCYTNPESRGKGLYPYVINQISEKYPSQCWIISEVNNHSSSKGIMKSGFEKIAKGRKTIFKQYILNQSH